MAPRELASRGRQFARDRPGTSVAAVAAVYLALDLLAKLFFFEATVGSVKLFGGSLAVSQLSTWLWQGTVVGLAYGLAAVGLSMVYSILRFPNFAHGELFTAGGFAGWSVAFVIAGLGQFDVGYLALLAAGPVNPTALGINAVATPLVVLVGIVFAALFTVAIALFLDWLVYEPIRDRGVIALLLASIGVALTLRYVINFVYGGSTIGLTANIPKVSFGAIDGQFVAAKQSSTFLLAQNGNAPGAETLYFRVPLLDIGSYTSEIVGISAHEAVLVVVAVLLMYGLHLLLQRTKLGTAMRAMADNKDLARVTGIPTERVIRDTWIIGAALVGVAGFLFSLESGTIFFRQGWVILLLVFAAVIVGGIGSIYGAMAGGYVIGIVSNVSLVWIPSSLTAASAFAIMILVLLFKPAGLFGGVTTA